MDVVPARDAGQVPVDSLTSLSSLVLGFNLLMLSTLRDIGGTVLPRMIEPIVSSVMWRLPIRPTDGAFGQRVAALTFDDGPTADGTPLLLDVLAEFDVPATHFVLGSGAESHPKLIERMVQAGHKIGNHSWDHPDGWRTTTDVFLDNFQRADRLLSDMLQEDLRWVRPPYGKLTPALLRWTRQQGQQLVMWDTMPADYAQHATVDSVRNGTAKLRSRSVVCLHDNASSRLVTPMALRSSLPRLLDDGWTFVTLP